LVAGIEIVVLRLFGVGGQTTAGKFVEKSFLVKPTLIPLATRTTAIVEMARSVGR
jgi:hypothetical protein